MAGTLRIKGLVRAVRELRTRLAAGHGSADRTAILAEAAALRAQVDMLCAEAGLRPAMLPAPSRQAYAFLVDSTQNVARTIAGAAQAALPPRPARPTSARVTGLVACWSDLNRRLWTLCQSEGAEDPCAVARRATQRAAERAAKALARAGLRDELLPPPSRRVMAALRYLAQPAIADQAVAAFQAARSCCTRLALRPDRIDLSLANGSHLWRRHAYGGRTRVQVSIAFLGAPSPILASVLDASLAPHNRQTAAEVRSYAVSEPYLRILRALEPVGRSTASRGVAHDLAESHARIVSAVGGALAEALAAMAPLPPIEWGERLTRRRVGRYDAARHRIVISPVLDHADVPACVVDYVVFHELLHVLHGIRVVGGRARAHTPAFRRDEMLFPDWQGAERFLTRWVSGR